MKKKHFQTHHFPRTPCHSGLRRPEPVSSDFVFVLLVLVSWCFSICVLVFLHLWVLRNLSCQYIKQSKLFISCILITLNSSVQWEIYFKKVALLTYERYIQAPLPTIKRKYVNQHWGIISDTWCQNASISSHTSANKLNSPHNYQIL